MTDTFGRTIPTNSFVVFPLSHPDRGIRVGLVISDRPEDSKARVLAITPSGEIGARKVPRRVFITPSTTMVVPEDLLPTTTTKALWGALAKENEQMYMEKQIQDEIGQY